MIIVHNNVNTDLNTYTQPKHNPDKFLSQFHRLYNNLTQNCINNGYGTKHLIQMENNILNVLHTHVIRTNNPQTSQEYSGNYTMLANKPHQTQQQYHQISGPPNNWWRNNNNQNIPIYKDNTNDNDSVKAFEYDDDNDIELSNNMRNKPNDPPKKKRKY